MRIDLWMTDVVTVVVGHGPGLPHLFPTDASQRVLPTGGPSHPHALSSTHASGLFLAATWRQGDRRARALGGRT